MTAPKYEPIFALARCTTCHSEHAFNAHPLSGFHVYDRAGDLKEPTHISLGFPVCVRGHPLQILHRWAVRAMSGRWLVLNEIDDAQES